MRILYLTEGESIHNACVFYRCYLPAIKLNQYFGWQGEVAQIDGRIDINFENALRKADIIIFTRHGHWDESIRLAKDFGKVTVYDTDDYGVLDYRNPAYNISILQQWQKRTLSSLAHTHYGTVSTKQLKEEYQSKNIKIFVLPNMLDLSHSMWQKPKKPHEGIVIGYYGGFSHIEDLKLLRGIFGQLCREFDSVKVAIGAKAPIYIDDIIYDKTTKRVTFERKSGEKNWEDIKQIFKDIPEGKLIPLERKEIIEYGTTYSELDIVVVPLCDTRFNRAKSNLKILEAGAYALPVVASKIRPYSETIEHRKDGFLARNGKDFYKYLKRLVVDESLRETMGRQLHQKIKQNFDINMQISQYQQIYQRMLNDGEAKRIF